MIALLAIAVIVGVAATPLIGEYLERRRIRAELRALLATSDADWAQKHREWMRVKRPESLSKLYRDALVDSVSDDREAFHLDENEQPHKPAA